MAHLRFAARDPGGANVLAGFLAGQRAQFSFDVWTLPRATAVFDRAGINCIEFPEAFEETDIRHRWNQQPAAALVTGTSHYAPFEPLLWKIAREKGVPSLAVNDTWANLASRFASGKPDFVGAVDAGQLGELKALGFAREQMFVTGHPWLASVMSHRKELEAKIEAPRREAGVKVLFVSEPIASDVAAGVNEPFGFEEFDSFALLHRAAAAVATPEKPVTLAIKFHPYEDAPAFTRRLEQLPGVSGLNVCPLGRAEKPHPWILWADLVTGVSSMLLLEAIVFGKPVVSIQPGLQREDTFIASCRGYADIFREEVSAVREVQSLIRDQDLRKRTAERNRGFLKTLHPHPGEAIRDWIQQRIAA